MNIKLNSNLMNGDLFQEKSPTGQCTPYNHLTSLKPNYWLCIKGPQIL